MLANGRLFASINRSVGRSGLMSIRQAQDSSGYLISMLLTRHVIGHVAHVVSQME